MHHIGLYYYPSEHGYLIERAMREGVANLGWRPTLRNAAHYHRGERENFDLVCVWSQKSNRLVIRDDYASVGVMTVVVDMGAIGRSKGYYYVGPDGLGWLPPHRCNAKRRTRVGLTVSPRRVRRPSGAPILLAGQIPNDAQHNLDEAALADVLAEYVHEIRRYSKRPILWRPHPLCPNMELPGVDAVSNPLETPLNDDIERCYAMVTFNSSSAWEALRLGMPVICDECAVFADLANTSISRISRLVWNADVITQYINRQSYCHWTRDEICAGKPLRWLAEHGYLVKRIMLEGGQAQ